MKVIFCLYKPDSEFRVLMQSGEVDLKIRGAFMTKFQDMHRNGAFCFCKHPCYSQSITTIIPLTAKNMKFFLCIVIPLQPIGTFAGCSFHQVDRSDRFMLDCILIPQSYFF